MAKKINKPIQKIDPILFGAFISLISFGLIMVTSASLDVAQQSYNDPFYFTYRHSIYLAIALAASSVCLFIPVQVYRRLAWLSFIGSIAVLCLVLIPGVGRTINGSTRWLAVGSLTFQVSELAKLGVFIYMAHYLSKHQEAIKTSWHAFLRPLMLLGIIAVLLLLEPDFGATVVITATVMGMMFLAGVRLRQFLALSAVVLVAFIGLAVSSPYRLKRLTGFLNPWDDQFNSGYQLTQALIAFGRGEWFGVGLGNSLQKLFYLPEAYSDFIVAVVAEELGLIGVTCLLALFALLVVRIFIIGAKAEQHSVFAGLLAYGIAMWVSFQVLINIGVNSGMLPTKGLTLPFVSYGGSSIIVLCLSMAIVFRIFYESQLQHRQKQTFEYKSNALTYY